MRGARNVFRGSDGRLRAVWRIAAIAIPGIVAVQAVAFGSGFLLPAPWSFLVAGFLMVAVAVALVGPLARLVDRRPLVAYGLRLGRPWWRDFAIGLAIGLAIPALAFAVLLATGQARVVEVFSPGEEVTFWAALIPVLVYWTAVAFWEELVFRGVMLKNAAEGLAGRLRHSRATLAALAITTLVFAAGHANQFLATDAPIALAALLWVALGAVLGVAYVVTGSLAAPIGIHLTVNAGLIYVFGITAERGAEFPTLFRLETTGSETIAGPGGVITIVAALAGLALVLAWARMRGDWSTHLRGIADPPIAVSRPGRSVRDRPRRPDRRDRAGVRA